MQMISDTLFDVLMNILQFVFGWINLPQFPDTLRESISTFLDLIFENVGFVGFFIHGTTLKIILPLFIILINFKFIYNFIMWILKKIEIFK